MTTIPAEARARVEAALDAIAVDDAVRIPIAIESGSRAWGFPSPDSDYDARFIYLRAPERYLRLERDRDVIEREITGDLDVNGWDLGKALRLILKSNAVVLEWLQSPIRYRDHPELRAALLEFAERALDRRALTWHYLRLADGARKAAGDGQEVKLKKLFYALRPALALTWLEQRTDPPPMQIGALMSGLELPQGLQDETDALIARKARTRELGTAPAPQTIVAFVRDALEQAAARTSEPRDRTQPDLREEAEDIFRHWVYAV
ncbi:nucleotidyltransferase domain-containing protein [Pontivivens ytuae]|uniref:Nucleotidyltransferase domain-containing protein n=1 Tax=Pontivivens ytuae TaxID=2789856 RepID=A0A7S9LSL2_9RHOB|nr:nucleotidyltransferase domain-containing protein [Pontivivens ytuae]QPH54349.1 nucleotidyltransferase domain-containing protein [Pontivivens ytuae]